MSRNINRMSEDLRVKYELFKKKMEEAGLYFIITSVDRSILEQVALYVQGRMFVRHVNKIRHEAGLAKIYRRKNRIVTWTLKSAHIINPFDVNVLNNFSNAFDIALRGAERRGVHWNLKADVNDDEVPDYKQAGRIGESVGLKWGGKYKDYCHFQL